MAPLEALVVVELLEEVFEPEAAAEVAPVDPVLVVVAEVVAAVPVAAAAEPDDLINCMRTTSSAQTSHLPSRGSCTTASDRRAAIAKQSGRKMLSAPIRRTWNLNQTELSPRQCKLSSLCYP